MSKIYGFNKQEGNIIEQSFLGNKSEGVKYKYHESRMLKKIKKSAILKRLQNYWKDPA